MVGAPQGIQPFSQVAALPLPPAAAPAASRPTDSYSLASPAAPLAAGMAGSGVRVPLFLAPPQGTGADGGSSAAPPPGSGGEGDGPKGPGKRGRATFVLSREFQDAIPGFESAEGMTSLFDAHLAELPPEMRLKYVYLCNDEVANGPRHRLSPGDHLAVIHHFMRTADGLTPHINPASKDWHGRGDIHNIVKYPFSVAMALELDLLKSGSPDDDSRAMIAYIASVMAMKGYCYYALGDLENGRTESPSVYCTLLTAIEAAARYRGTGRVDDAARVYSFVGDFADRAGIDGSPAEWAMESMTRDMAVWAGHLSDALSDSDDNPRSYEGMLIGFRAGFDAWGRDHRLYTQRIYETLSSVLEEHGLSDVADEYAARAEEAGRLAEDLGLSI
jgi:hypothetical protein